MSQVIVCDVTGLPDQTRPDQTRPNQTGPDRTGPDQTEQKKKKLVVVGKRAGARSV